MAKELDKSTREELVRAQRNEITEYRIYRKLADYVEDEANSEIMREIAEDELEHYNFWKEYTGEEVKPSWLKVWFYYGIAIVFGITFGIKLMEQGEEDAQETYSRVAVVVIFFFNYYVSVAQGVSFRDRFTEMAGISLGVAGLSFVIGFVIRHFMGVEI